MRKKAITLIELIIVIAIIGIMTSVLLVSLGSGRTNKALETAAREVSAAVREAQNYALTGKGAGAGCNTYTFSYGLGVDSDEYKINNGAGCGVDDNYKLKNGVVFQGSGGSFDFLVPFGIISILPVNSPEAIVLNNDKTIRVCVYSSGKVEETDIGAACP